MNLNEAYSILELTPGTSPEDAKKQYRKLTKEFHPDVNKNPGAEDKFKKINEAYQCVQNGKGSDKENPSHHYYQHQRGSYNPFEQFSKQKNKQVENIELHSTVSFKDSVFGCKVELKFNRQTKCQNCNGQGEISLNNGCINCGGKGQIVGRQGNTIFMRTCDKCFGQTKTSACNPCKGDGSVSSDVSIQVAIPPGIQNNNILRLSAMGHYVGSFLMSDQYADAYLHVHVNIDPDLKIEGMDIISFLDLSLLEALQGCTKQIRTVIGMYDIEVKPLSKNKDEIKISSLGVNQIGSQRVILNVSYPNDTRSIIDLLVANKKEN